MKEVIFVVEEAGEGGYTAHALGHSIFAQAETMEELRVELIDAVRCHFDEPDLPRMVRLHFTRDEVLAL